MDLSRYRCIDGEHIPDHPDCPDTEIASSSFLEGAEIAPSNFPEGPDTEIDSSNFDTNDWEVVLDVPVRLPQSDGNREDLPKLSNHMEDIPFQRVFKMGEMPQTSLDILLGDKLVDEGDLVGGRFGVVEERPGYRLVGCVFDTGAFHSVTTRGIFPGPIVFSAMSRAGKKHIGGQTVPESRIWDRSTGGGSMRLALLVGCLGRSPISSAPS